MPDVGTLYIGIESNADKAAEGLGTLASKLGSVKKNADGFDLSNVKTQITNIVNAVKGSEKTMASLGTLFNATATYFKAFGKITDKISVNTKPIEDLKKAFGEGIKTGNVGSQLNQLRTALEGEWRTDNAYNAGMALSAIGQGAKDAESTNLASVASNVSAVAKALNEYADASARIKEVSGVEGIKTAFETLGTNAGTGYVQGMESMKTAVSDASAKTIEAGYEAGADAQQSHSPSLLYEQLGAYAGEGYVEGIRSKISAVTAIVSEMVQAAIASSEGKTAQVAQAVSDAIKTAFSSALSGMDLSDVQKSMIQRTANLTADVVRSFAETSKASLEDTAKVASDIVSSAMTGATSKALDSMQPLQDGIQQFNSELQTSGTYVENNIDEGIKESVKETAEMNERLQMTNEELQEQLRIRKEILDAQNQARLESNYGLYRELYMSGEGDWKQQVPEMYGFTEKAIEANETYAGALKDTIQECNEYVDRFIEKQNTPAGPLLSDVLQQADDAKLAMKQASESAAVLRNAPEVTELSSGMQQVQSASQTMNSSLEQTKTATRVLTDDMKDLDSELKQKKPDSLKAKDGIDKFKFSLKDLNKGLKAAFPLLSTFGSKLKSIIIRRTLTAMVRKIVSSAKEGLQNVYEYSKAVGTSFAPAMDSAASSLATMKNALGAALAPAVQALIPVLQSVVSWFINLVNQANQFFALINGQKTWTRALPQTVSAFDKQEKAAKKAGAAIKDLLADWDELNIIQSNTSGAGSGAGTSAAEDYLNMFEEVNTFDRKVKDVVDFIKDNFDSILKVVEGIGAAILLWKISEAFGHSLGMLQKLELAAGLTLLISGIKLAADVGYDIGKNGINGKNAITAVGAVLESMLGGGLAGIAFGGIEGGIIGLAVGAFLALTVLQIKLNQGHLDSLYGEATKSTEEIVDELKENVLTAEANLEINVLAAHLKDVEDAKTKVNTALTDLSQSYPVGVEVTPDDAETFKGKVNALVQATNELIAERNESMKQIEVPAMAVFGPTFVDDAWGGISDYVTQLGNEIGTELSKSTVDAVKLDDLRKKLMEMSTIIANAQRSSEFTGSVSLISEDIRTNNMLGKYDRKTVQTYMEEYNNLLNNTKNLAKDKALDEYISAFTLVEALEKKKLDMGEAFDQESDLENAKRVLEEMGEQADYIAKRSQDLFDTWTKAGRAVYGNALLEAMSIAMGQNKNDQMRNMAISYATYGQGVADDEWVDKYIASNRAYLESAISVETGMPEDQIRDLINNSGINPLTFFDEDFVKEYRDKIVTWLIRSDLSESQKQKVLESIGLGNLDESVHKETVEEIKQKIRDYLKDDSKQGDISLLLLELDKQYIDGFVDEAIDAVQKEIESEANRWTLASDAIKEAVEGGLTSDEISGIKSAYTLTDADINKIISELNLTAEQLAGPLAKPYEGGSERPAFVNTNNEPMTEQDLSNGVESGTKAANAEQNEILTRIHEDLMANNKRPINVNVYPSAGWGFFNQKSGEAAYAVDGNGP